MEAVLEASRRARMIGRFYERVADREAAVNRLVESDFSEPTVSETAARLSEKLSAADITAARTVLARAFALHETEEPSAEAVVQVVAPVIAVTGGSGSSLAGWGAFIGGAGALLTGVAAVIAAASDDDGAPEENG